MLFTVTNPPRGTVSVTALANGQPVHVELAPPEVVDMPESQLSEEISVIAGLATQNARAGQHLLRRRYFSVLVMTAPRHSVSSNVNSASRPPTRFWPQGARIRHPIRERRLVRVNDQPQWRDPATSVVAAPFRTHRFRI